MGGVCLDFQGTNAGKPNPGYSKLQKVRRWLMDDEED